MDKKIFLILFVSLFLISMVNASLTNLGTYQINSCIQLIQTCGNCTYGNVTSVISPNSIILLNNVNMQQTGTYYNYTFCNTSYLGTYIVNGVSDVNGVPTVWAYSFLITSTGNTLTTGNSIIMVVGLIVLILTTLVLFYFGMKTENITIKIFTLGLSLVMLIFSIGYSLTVLNTAIPEFTAIQGIINVIYILGIALLTVGGISVIVWLIAHILEMFSKYRGFRD